MDELKRSEQLLEMARMAAWRLERISADSIWAHRSSGTRGSLLRQIDRVEKALRPEGVQVQGLQADLDRLEGLLAMSFWMLEQAAKEL